VQVVLSSNNRFGPSSQVLTTFALAGLGSGQEFSPGVFTVTLPDLATATASGFPATGPVYLGLRIDPAGTVPELNRHDQSGVHRGEDWEKLTVVTPVAASGNNHSPASAEVLPDPNSRVRGVLTAGQTDWYQITVPATGRLTAVISASGGSTWIPRLTLTGPNGHVLVQSDNAITQNLPPGTYLLAVSASSGRGNYELTTDWVPGSAPFSRVAVGPNFLQGVVADLTGDGIPDIVSVPWGYAKPSSSFPHIVNVVLGNGDGTFQPALNYPVGLAPDGVAVADVNGDGIPDIIVANQQSDSVSVLLGNGDGTFQPQQTYTVGVLPSAVAVADVNGDGIPDIITGNQGAEGYAPPSVSVLLGNGDGSFRPQQTFRITTDRSLSNVALAVADVNGDGKPDIVTANTPGFRYATVSDGSVSVLLGNGDGTFQLQKTFPVGVQPYSVAVADLNGDGRPDIVTANKSENTVSVLMGHGDGSFAPQKPLVVGQDPTWVAVTDVNGDGKPDIITADKTGPDISVLLGNGAGTFQPQETFPVDVVPNWIGVADDNGDGKPDVVAGGGDSILGEGIATVLLGNGDGTFQVQASSTVGSIPRAMAVADLNGDGKPDLVTANFLSGTVSVLLGNGTAPSSPSKPSL
jgi:hypothetical protein